MLQQVVTLQKRLCPGALATVLVRTTVVSNHALYLELHRGDCWQPYSNLMVHQLCAAAHEAVPSYNEDLLHKCYTDGDWALEVAKQRLVRNFAVVGILERMDETLSLLDRAFGF